jgi:hypothetical protein
MTTMMAERRSPLPLFLLLIFFVASGCSDRLAPPTGNAANAESAVAFSWTTSIDAIPTELPQIATISSRGRNRAELTVDGVILAMKNGRMVIARLDTDSFDGLYDTLMYGSLDGTVPLEVVAAETFDLEIDFGSMALSDDGTRLAYYSSEYYRGTLNLVDLGTTSPLSPARLDLNFSDSEITFPPPAFSPDGESLAYIDYE